LQLISFCYTLLARQPDVDSLLPLLELVIGAAVMCDNKGDFISRIFALDQDSQVVLKQMIESVMARVTNVTDALSERDEFGVGSVGAGDESEDLVRAQELARHLQEERAKLLREVESLERGRVSMQLELETSRAQVHSLQQLLHSETADNAASESRSSGASSLAAQATLQAELEELRRELDLQTVENANLKTSLKTAQQRSEAAREVQAKLEMELHQMTDELDVSRDKAQKLAKAEATIDKYQKKLEEMVILKKQNKEYSDKLESYFDKIQELESGAKSIGTLNKLVEQYRDKAVELEREKFEAQSALELSAHEVRRLQGDMDAAHEAKRFLEDEVESLR